MKESMVDEVDLKIIKFLSENSRISFAELSKNIFLSPSSVRERIRRMEDTGVIKKYTIEVNQALLGNSLEVFIMLKVFTGRFKNAFAKINSFPEVQQAHRITGQHNIHMRVVLRDQLHLQQFIDELILFGEPTTHLILSELEKE